MTARAYYNENDRFAAAWLRELIKRDLIADGDVDERSIEDVQSAELTGFTQCHFFAGIGGWSYALRLAGVADTEPVWRELSLLQTHNEISLFLMSAVIMVDLYWAQRSSTKRPGLFYAAAAVMLYAALMLASG